MAALCAWQAGTAAAINVRDYGAIPDDGRNDAEALRAAVADCRKTGASTLVFPAGQYLLADARAVALQDSAMSGKFSDLQNAIFTPHYKYVIGLDLTGIKDLTIEAKGAELLCDGWMEPLTLAETENLVINGLSIDYARPPNSAGRIVAVGNGTLDVRFYDRFPVADGFGFLRTMIWDDAEARYLGGAEVGKGKLIGPQVLRFTANSGLFKAGRALWGLHGFHFRPAILLYRAKNTTLNDVSIYAQPGMGIVGHLSENIYLNRLRIVPKDSTRFCSSNTDATHFAACYGALEFQDCDFGGQGDDATNVHVYYDNVLSRPGANSAVLGMAGSFDLHSQKPDFPRVGDSLAVINAATLEETGATIRVTRIVAVDPADYHVTLEFAGTLPTDMSNRYLANVSALPRLVFRACRVASHRARSVLCKTRTALIENNRFYGSTGTAIELGIEGPWKEGVGSRDVIIRGNTFVRNGGGDGTIDAAAAIAITVDAPTTGIPGLHKRILIEKNTIGTIGAAHAISVKGAEDITIRGNTFADSSTGNALLSVNACRRVAAYGNSGLKDYFSGDGQPQLPSGFPSAVMLDKAPGRAVRHSPGPRRYRYSVNGRVERR